MDSLKKAVKDKIEDQNRRNAARKIIGTIRSWDLKQELAAFRWPCELLQNAVDTAKRWNKDLTVTITFAPDRLLCEHSGGPFDPEEIGALILAGSAKPFDNSPYTGRFGTGFLVTHALSPLVRASGKVDGRLTGFQVTLDRRGSESEIQDKIDACYEELDAPSSQDMPDARFEYVFQDQRGISVARNGLAKLDELLPYIFAFNPNLKKVLIQAERSVLWERGESQDLHQECLALRQVNLARQDGTRRTEYELLSGLLGHDCSAVLLLELEPDSKRVFLEPSEKTPRIFRNLPLNESEHAGLPVIIDGPFEVDEQRTALFLGSYATDDTQTDGKKSHQGNQELALGILGKMAPFLAHVAKLDVLNAHKALAIHQPAGSLATAVQWREGLKQLTAELATLPILRTPKVGFIAPAKSVLPVAEVGRHATGVRVSSGDFWSLVATYTDNLPCRDIAGDWESIAAGWRDLGVPLLGMCNVETVVGHVKECGTLVGLAEFLKYSDETDALRWLCSLLDCLAPCADQIPNEVLSGILPDQVGKLRETRDLSIDLGIDPALKDIAEGVLDPLRPQLLDTRLVPTDAIHSRHKLLYSHVNKTMAEEEAVTRVIQKLRHTLREKEKALRLDAAVEKDTFVLQTARVAIWLSEKAPAFDQHAKELPLISAGKTLLDSPRQLSLLPVEAWEDNARPFVDVFPEAGRVSSLYWTEAREHWPRLQSALIKWERCYADLVVCETETRLKGDLLRKLVQDRELVAKVSKDADY